MANVKQWTDEISRYAKEDVAMILVNNEYKEEEEEDIPEKYDEKLQQTLENVFF